MDAVWVNWFSNESRVFINYAVVLLTGWALLLTKHPYVMYMYITNVAEDKTQPEAKSMFAPDNHFPVGSNYVRKFVF